MEQGARVPGGSVPTEPADMGQEPGWERMCGF